MMGGGPARTYVFLDYSSAPNAISSPGSEDRASRKKLPGHFRGKKRRSRKILHWKHLPPTSVSSFRSSFPSSYIENNMKKTRGERKWASSSAKFLETAFSNLAMICGGDKWLKSANVQLRARQRRFWICRHPPYCCSMYVPYLLTFSTARVYFLWIRLLHSAFLFDSTDMNITLNYVFWKDLAQMLCVFFYGHTLYGIRKCSSSALRSSRSSTWGAKWIGHLLMLLFYCQILWPIIWQPIRYAGR